MEWKGCGRVNLSIRPVRTEDAQALWQMMTALDSETDFMLYEPMERGEDTGRLQAAIQQAVQGDDFLWVAQSDADIVGYLSARRGGLRRIRHTAYLVIGIRKRFQGQGLGTQLFSRLDRWARDVGVTRLELTVLCSNHAAKRLYEKNGFAVEGVRKNSMLVNGSYVDEYYMAKLIPTD